MHHQFSEPPFNCIALHPPPLPFFLLSGAWDLPSGLCRSSWLAPFEAFHSCFGPQDCPILPWLCSVNNSPAASLLPPSFFCSSPLYIYLYVRGGSVKSVRQQERETGRERATQSGFKRRSGGGVLLNTGIEQRAASLWCSRWAWMSCLLGLELQKCALLYNDTLKAGKWHHNKERDECGGCAGGWWGLGGLMVKKKKKGVVQSIALKLQLKKSFGG